MLQEYFKSLIYNKRVFFIRCNLGNSSRIYDSTIPSTVLPLVIQSDPELVKLFKSTNDLNAAVSNDQIIAYIHKVCIYHMCSHNESTTCVDLLLVHVSF